MGKNSLVIVVCLLAAPLLLSCGGGEGGEAGPTGGSDGPAAESNAEKGKPSAVVDEYYASMKAGDMDRMFATFAPEMASVTEEQIATLGDNPREAASEVFKEITADLVYEIAEEEFGSSDSECKVVVNSTANDTEDTISISLVKKDGKWLISNIE